MRRLVLQMSGIAGVETITPTKYRCDIMLASLYYSVKIREIGPQPPLLPICQNFKFHMIFSFYRL